MKNKQKTMSEATFVKKGNMAGNYDEMIMNLRDVREVPNLKPDQKPKVDHYISGRVAVDIGDGKIYYPRVDIEISKGGNTIGYDIADIKEFPTYHLDDQTQVRKGTSRDISISQNPENIQIEFGDYNPSESLSEIRKYHERYIKDKNERLNIREGVDRVRSSDMIAKQYMKDHGLEEIGKMSDADLNEFQQYFIAKRALKVAEQGKATGRSIKITLVAMSDDIIYESKQRAFYGAKNLSKLCNATNFRRYVFY